MTTIGADAWRSGGLRTDLPPVVGRGPRAERGPRGETMPPDRPRPRPDRPPLPSRGRATDRGATPARVAAEYNRSRDDRGRDDRARDRDDRGRRGDARGDARAARDPRAAAADRDTAAPARRSAPVEAGRGRLRGVLAVLAVFLVTLAAAGVDSFVGTGLGTVTLVALAVSTLAAAALVRRRDLLSVLVAPPLVFVVVAAVDLALAPSATLNLASVATLLIRGFPTMAVGVVAGLVVAVLRMAARR